MATQYELLHEYGLSMETVKKYFNDSQIESLSADDINGMLYEYEQEEALREQQEREKSDPYYKYKLPYFDEDFVTHDDDINLEKIYITRLIQMRIIIR